MIIRGLGVVGAIHGGELTRLQPAQKRILAVLMAAGPEGLSADRFADQVWPDALPTDWEAAVRQSISRMRRAIGLRTIVSSTRHYSLSPETDVDVWRLLDLANGPLDELTGDELAAFIAGEPYPGIDPSPVLRSSIREIAASKISVITALTDRRDLITNSLLEASVAFQVQEPHREDVLVATTRLCAAAGLPGLAIQHLDEGVVRLEEEIGLPVGTDLHDLRTGLLAALQAGSNAGDDETVVVDVESAPPRLVGNADLSPAGSYVERPELFEAAQTHLAAGGVVVTGQSGSGKTVLARSLARASLDAGAHVLWLSAPRDQRAAYGPFFTAVPWLAEALKPLVQEGGGDLYTRSRCWAAALEALAWTFTGRPLAIFVDDAQWLDSHSQMLLEFLVQSRGPHGFAFAVIGRTTGTDDNWPRLSEDLQRAGLKSVETTEFSPDELVVLASKYHPSSSSKQRVDAAAGLAASRATLPAVAHELLRTADPATLISSQSTSAPTQRGIWTSAVSASSQSIGASAAVAGITFRLHEVALLTGLPVEEVLGGVDELLDAQLVTSEQRPDEFSFRHLLIHEAFESLLDWSTRRKLHLAAASSELDSDPHRRAAHLATASPLVSADELSQALVHSARLHHNDGSFREAVAAFAQAIEVAPSPPGARLLLDYANSLDLSGADGRAIRVQAFEAAQGSGDHDLSVEAAIGNAHETEVVDGDPSRVALLERVDVTQIGTAAAQAHQVALGRELSFLGHHERAREMSTQVMEAATSPDGRCAGWLAAWPTYLTTPASDWPMLPGDRNLVSEPLLLAQMLQVECLHALLLGDDAQARELLSQCTAATARLNPLRVWFVSLLEALFAFTDGALKLSSELADAALVEAQRAGISSASSAWTAQAFARAWVNGKHGSLLTMLEQAAPDVRGSMLAEAAQAITLATEPTRRDEAITKISGLTRRVTESQSPMGSAVAALLASATSDATPRETVDELSSVLLPFAGTSLVVGTGVTTLGPASRSLSMLARSADDKVALMSQAIEEADRWNLRLWSVRCRLDITALTGDARLRSEAREIAADTDLVAEMFGEEMS